MSQINNYPGIENLGARILELAQIATNIHQFEDRKVAQGSEADGDVMDMIIDQMIRDWMEVPAPALAIASSKQTFETQFALAG